MASHALDQQLFDQMDTISTASPTDGAELINKWLKVIDGNNTASILEGRLKELRGQLLLAKPDADRMRELLLDVADHTALISQSHNVQQQTAGKLVELSTGLRQLASQL